MNKDTERPRKPARTDVGLRLTADDLAALDKLAGQQGETRGGMANKIVEDYISKLEKS